MNRSLFNKASAHRRSPGFFLSILLVTFMQSAAGQDVAVVRMLDVTGNKSLTTGELLEGLRTAKGARFDSAVVREDLDAIRDRYHREGYLSCSVEVQVTADGSARDVHIRISEGRRVVLGSVEVDRQDSSRVVRMPELPGIRRGDPFSQAAIDEGIHRLLVQREGEGHPLASVTVSSVFIDTSASVDSAHVVLSLKDGPTVEVTQVRIEGNTTTTDDVILREVRLKEHTFYSDEHMQEIKRRLERLQLFTGVAVPEFYLTPQGAGGILIRVQEGQQNRFDGIVGYVPGVAAEPGYVTGLIDLQFRNLFGTGRKLTTRWSRESRSTQDLAVRYREPWVASWPVNAEIGFGQRKQDSTYLRRAYDGSAEFMVNEELTIGLVLSHAAVYPTDRPQNPVARSSNTTVGGSVRFDSRDDPVTPGAGVLYSTTIEIGNKSVETGAGRGDFRTRRASFDLEYYLGIAERQVVAVLLHGRTVDSPSLDQSDLFRLGGAATLRGYREAQFLGSSAAWMNGEYRLMLGGRSFAYGFVDVGYLALPNKPLAGLTKSELTRTGYGIGARVDTRLGLIGVSLGFGQGDTFSTAKLHIQLINEF